MGEAVFVTQQEANDFLNRNAWRYLTLLRKLRSIFTDHKHSRFGRSIHRIYTRGDKQPGGDEFKSTWGIVNKVNRMRRHGDPVNSIPADPNFFFTDLWDIIGLTIVCPRKDDVDTVVDLIRTGGNGIQKMYDRAVTSQGYRGHHFVLSLSTPIVLLGVKCEVQIKSLLEDAYSALTHDVTYKPPGEIPVTTRALITEIATHLHSIDRQVTLLNEDVRKHWEAERKKNEAQRTELISDLYAAAKEKSRSDQKRWRAFMKITKEIKIAQAADKKALNDCFGKLDKFIDGSPDYIGCALSVYLAFISGDSDAESLSCDLIDKWIHSLNQRERREAYSLKAYGYYCFGRMVECICEARTALNLAVKEKLEIESLNNHRTNLAYYLADKGGEVTSDEAKEARQLIGKVLSNTTRKKLTDSQKDSIGFVLIKFGTCKEEVRRGLSMCRRVYMKKKNKKNYIAAYAYHEKIAQERLTSLPT